MKFLEVPSVQTIQRSPRLPKDSKMDKILLIVNLSLGRPEEVPVSPGRYPWRPGEVLMKFQEVPSVQTIKRSPMLPKDEQKSSYPKP